VDRKFRITVDGRAYVVTVEDLSDGPSRLYPEPGSMSVQRPAAAPAITSPPAGHAPPSARAAGPGDVVATLGGIVSEVVAGVGQAVAAGDTVVVIEAMKMKSHMLAPRAGRVTAVVVAAGHGVEPGQVLATID
jgi:biotin carboxyl carrier protein